MRFFAAVVLALIIAVGNAWAEEKPELKDRKEKVSYSMGFDIGSKLKQQEIEFDVDVFTRGMKDALGGSKAALTEKEMQEALSGLQRELIAKQQERQKQLSEKNKKEGEAFLAENKKKEGVVELPSGLQYKVIEEGKGKKPAATDTVVVHYRGTLLDGTEFDSSYKRHEPATFPVNGVIAGWTEALQLMKEGSKWQIFIPSKLAYGERGAGGVIGPNATLIFDVELISVNPKPEEKSEEKK